MNNRRRPQLSLDLLRGFRAAARSLSFTRAAEDLSVTQSAISHEIRTLEEQIGQPLFERVHRGLRLTRAGEELFRVVDESLEHIDAVVDRLVGSGKSISVTTTSGLASLWLAPRLPRFNHAHPGIDVHVVASNDKPDLERDDIDVAIRFVQPGEDVPDSERLMDCNCFPVCSPALAANAAHPIRAPADLAHHVMLDYETIRNGRRVSEWGFWFDAVKTRRVTPASTLRFPQYDQVVAAAVEGSGVAMGELPHLAQHLREGILCAPFGPHGVARRGTYFVVRRKDVAKRAAVEAFVDWLWSEAKREGESTLAAVTAGDASPGKPAPASRSRPRAGRA